MPELDRTLTSVGVTGVLSQGNNVLDSSQWMLANEVPVALVYNGKSHAVMMASPLDLEDFAIGFSLSEEIVLNRSAIRSCQVVPCGGGIRLCIVIDETQTGRGWAVERHVEGRSGCGLCGVAEIEDAVRVPSQVLPLVKLPDPETVLSSFNDLPNKQSINQVNHSVHAAAFCTMDGTLQITREDVGRHNALDKVLGALTDSPYDAAQGYIIMTSRCSFELVQKVAACGIAMLATLSAPTALALDLADKAGVKIMARASKKSLMLLN